MSHRRRSSLEKKIQADIEAAIGAEHDLLLLRNAVGEAKFYKPDGSGEWHVPFGLGVGSPDLVSMLTIPFLSIPIATWFCLEVKADEGELSDEQETCHRIWRKFGAQIFVVRSVDEARVALFSARATLRDAFATRAA